MKTFNPGRDAALRRQRAYITRNSCSRTLYRPALRDSDRFRLRGAPWRRFGATAAARAGTAQRTVPAISYERSK